MKAVEHELIWFKHLFFLLSLDQLSTSSSKMLKKIFRGKVLWIKMSKYGCSGRQGGVKM